jgi:hypothetical protein
LARDGTDIEKTAFVDSNPTRGVFTWMQRSSN